MEAGEFRTRGRIYACIIMLLLAGSGCSINVLNNNNNNNNNFYNAAINQTYEVELMESKVMEQIRKMTVGAGEDTKFDIQEIEVQYKLPGVYFLRSAYRFNFDPVPWDKWIVDGEKVRHGREILDLLKEKEIEPKSKEEAINLAKLALLVGEGELRIYPEFDAKGCKKPDAVEKDGAYEATLYISHGFSFQPPMPVKAVFTFGKGVYEKSFERMQSP